MKTRRLLIALFLFAGILFANCGKEDPTIAEDDTYTLNIPVGFATMMMPDSNMLSKSRVALGSRLFSDVLLSRTNEVSCASCHKANFAFADSVAFSPGVEGRAGVRNAPTLANVGYLDRLLSEGGVPSLEMQVLVPIQEHNEFDFNILEIVERLKNDASYVEMSQKAYNRQPDAYVITRALAAFERTLISGNSPYDQYVYQNKPNALTASQKAGMLLFNSDSLACSKCHAGFLLTNQGFENNGLYEVYPDSGRIRLTMNPTDRGKFKVPTLRNIAKTAPYMHDGSLPNLAAVIEHYASGGANHPNKNPLIGGFVLTETEKANLKAFLESLTDEGF